MNMMKKMVVSLKKEEIKPGSYMATRYLQPQHNDTIGLKSGDGRSIWNGVIENKGRTWDISSRGTGATCLSPATSKYGKFFKSGDPTISYGCGYAELDEAIESLFFSEVLHRNHLKTERNLAIIEFEKGIVVGVRAYENLMRPSHFFRLLKQNKLDSLKTMILYHTARQESNGTWKDVPKKEEERLKFFLHKQVEVFAQTAARFEDDYIFCWLDWDGDNVLMDGGIIDYGSVRQFGLYHHGYQFDDSGKYSITIAQQKSKARYITQTFIQMVEAVLHNKKTNIKEFAKHKLLTDFDKSFERFKNENIIRKIGFEESLVPILAKDPAVQKFRTAFAFWERVQARAGKYKVTDGISHDAVFCMRDILRELPQILLTKYEDITSKEFIEITRSSYAKDEDLVLNSSRLEHIKNFQENYRALIERATQVEKCSLDEMLHRVSVRSSIINKYDRITGDSITLVAAKIVACKPKLTCSEIFSLLEFFISYQDLNPDKNQPNKELTEREKKLMQAMFLIVKNYREGL